MTTLLIDADMLLYRTMSSLEVDCDMGNDIWMRHADIRDVRYTFWDQIQAMSKELKASEPLLFWTGPSGFRRRIFPEYKANRAGMRKPIGWRRIKDELLEEEFSYLHSEIEADDWLGIFSTAMTSANEKHVIVSGDKDLNQIPGEHHWPWKEETSWTITNDQAERQFYSQILIGDSTDNIAGCPGIGAVTAKRIVDKFDISQPLECWEEIVQQFAKALTKKEDIRCPQEVATLQARLVRILRHGEYDVSTRTVDLWTPPTLKS
jgi:DNA polymerase-1